MDWCLVCGDYDVDGENHGYGENYDGDDNSDRYYYDYRDDIGLH